MNFNIERQRIELLSEGARKREEESAGRMKVLQNALKNGEVSSGDNVTDFVVAQYGIFDDAFERPYRNLRESLQDNVGAEVLVVRKTRTEEDMFDMGSLTEGMLPPSKDYRVNLKLQFGRISRPTGLELNVADGMVAIVSLNHVFSEHEYPEVASDFVVVGNQEWIVTPGNIKNNYQDLPHLSEPLNKKMSSFYSGLISVSEQSSQILVGEEVENFFTNTSKAKKSYSKAKGLLSV